MVLKSKKTDGDVVQESSSTAAPPAATTRSNNGDEESGMIDNTTTTTNSSDSRSTKKKKGSSFFSSTSSTIPGSSIRTRGAQATAAAAAATASSGKGECTKYMIMAVLTLVAILAIISTYIITSNQERKDFEKQFHMFASGVIEVSNVHALSVTAAVEAMSVGVTSYVVDRQQQLLRSNTNETMFPFVSIPNFEAKGQLFLQQSGANLLTFSPLVNRKDIKAWENYAQSHQGWIQDGLDYQFYKNISNTKTIATPIIPYVHSHDSSGNPIPEEEEIMNDNDDNDDDLLAVTWQMAPAPLNPNLVNYNPLSASFFQLMFQGMVETQHAVFSQVVDFTSDTSIGQPQSCLLHPIYDKLMEVEDKTAGGGTTTTKKQLVGFINALMPWQIYFDNLLPNGVSGIILVLSNTCEQDYTYNLDGRQVNYVGEGDLHDKEFDDLKVSAPFYPWDNNDDEEDELSSSSSSSQCLYTIHVYPSQEFQSVYNTWRPGLYTAVVTLIFFLAGIVFVLYDSLMQKQQKKVLETATRASDLVESLFPATVRERLMEDQAAEEAETAAQNAAAVDSESALAAMSPRKAMKRIMKRHVPNRNSKSGGRSTTFSHPPSSDGGRRDSATTSLALASSIVIEEGSEGDEDERLIQATQKKPIADFFAQATILFADLVGFTAWSSVREPSQVFRLLETLYNGFDMIARRRGVFKVETIGDCYMAVTGVPNPRPDHALAMALFAIDCVAKMKILVLKLEVLLGPGTADLQIRVGLHSGPVTAGVLRGDRSRFQLFGDTVNTAARMESTGTPSRIHLSEDIARILIDAGKPELVRRRECKVTAKGKGELQTFWLIDPNSDETSSKPSSVPQSKGANGVGAGKTRPNESDSPDDGDGKKLSNRGPPRGRGNLRAQLRRSVGLARLGDLETRLSDYNVEVLQQLLKKLVASRPRPVNRRPSLLGKMPSLKGLGGRSPRDTSRKSPKMPSARKSRKGNLAVNKEEPTFTRQKDRTILDEASNIISFDDSRNRESTPADSIELKPEVVEELHHYVKTLSSLYRFNPFHCFEHASHATQSMTKMLARVTSEENSELNGEASFMAPIKYDPLTQFAMVFAALIHDVDHYGVPNSQLLKERGDIAEMYGNKSIAEQNSVDIAWDLLMGESYKELRACIYNNQAELNHFRQVVVNSVLATDVADKELRALRKKRWEKAFNSDSKEVLSSEDEGNQKATLVIEHMMQASNVAHSMQHWHVYLKWNERLFAERFKSYVAGREDEDPSIAWYEAELVYFDTFIIPLALRLKDAGVFGNASEEYLNYARTNKREWESKGRQIVERFIDTYQDRHSFLVKA